jgi:hypothetical protein
MTFRRGANQRRREATAMGRIEKRCTAVRPSQREVIRDVLFVARRYGAWMTLRELARLTGYGEASISAQLRHLRKEQYGGFLVRKRQRQGELGLTGGPVWEYTLGKRKRGGLGRRDVRGRARRRRESSRKDFSVVHELKREGKAGRSLRRGASALQKRGAR